MMTCPKIDRLSCYADDLCTGEELVEIRAHIEECSECREIIDVFKGEAQFIRETLQEPSLPENFTAQVLHQLEPKKRKRSKVWLRGLGIVAGFILAVGIGAAISPSFASQIGGLFTTKIVDDGLQIAEESGLTERVNLETTDKGITFKIEDLIVDSSRIALSHQFLNAKGQAIEIFDTYYEVNLKTIDGQKIELGSHGWSNYDQYGLFEFPITGEVLADQIVLDIHITKINGVKGTWQLEVPIDFTDVKEQTKVLALDGKEKDVSGVAIRIKEVQYAPSINELLYETSYTDEEEKRINNEIKAFEEKYGLNINDRFMFGTQIHYHVKNEKDEVVVSSQSISDSEHNRSIGSRGSYLENIGHQTHIDSFEPGRENEQLTFVLDGVEKVELADFSMEINQAELKKQPITAEYEGNTITVKSIEKEADYFFEKSLMPIKRQTYFEMKLEMTQAPNAPELYNWVIIDDKGQAYETYYSGSNEELSLYIYDWDKIPENFSLQLLTKTVFEEVDEKWEVPLYE